MHKFKAETVKIEVFQMTKERRQDKSEWPKWLNRAWNMNPDEVGSVSSSDYPNSDGTDQLIIHTLVGKHLVPWGDFIARGIQEELYLRKTENF